MSIIRETPIRKTVFKSNRTVNLNDFKTLIVNKDFYSTLGLDTKQFDKHVIRKTNQSAKTLFPVILDTENPQFYELLDLCVVANENLIQIEKEENSQFSKFFAKIPFYFLMISSLFKLFFLPAIETKYIWTLG